jgi:hypothetical protein
MSELVREQIKEVAWEMHAEHGCSDPSMRCMFPTGSYAAWCTATEAARLVGVANRVSGERSSKGSS